jgi:hypothetical protein
LEKNFKNVNIKYREEQVMLIYEREEYTNTQSILNGSFDYDDGVLPTHKIKTIKKKKQ